MKKASCLVVLLTVFLGVRPAGVHEVEVAPHSDGSFLVALKNPRELVRVGVRSLGNAAYEAALQRAALRTQQAKGLLDRINGKVRSVLGLPPKPKSLVAGEFLDNLTAAEKEKLEHPKTHTFVPRPAGNEGTSPQEVISHEAVRIGILKKHLDTVLADKRNYSDAVHINELIKEVDGLVKALEITVAKKASSYPDGEIDPDNNMDSKYVDTINGSLNALKNIQKMQKEISSLHLTWFQNYIGKHFLGTSLQGSNEATKRTIFSRMSSYLVTDSRTDSRGQNLTLQPGLLFLESMIRKQAFEFCKPILLKEYAPKSTAMKANVSQFFTDYKSYQEGGVGKLRIKSELDAIINPTVPRSSTLSHNVLQPVHTPLETPVTKPTSVLPDPAAKLYAEQQAEEALRKSKEVQAQVIVAQRLAQERAEADAQEMAELKKRLAAQEALKKLPPTPSVQTQETTDFIAEKNTQFDSVKTAIDAYKKQLYKQSVLIDSIVVTKPLQVTDLEKLLKAYQELQEGSGEYDQLSKKLNTIIIDRVGQAISGLGKRQEELATELLAVNSLRSKKVSELQKFGIEKLNKVIKTFTAVEKALEVEPFSFLQQTINYVNPKLPLSDDLVKDLCDAFLWEDSSSVSLQTGVRNAALEFLKRGLPEGQVKAMNYFYKQLVGYRLRVSEMGDSKNAQDMEQLVGELEALKTKVEESGVPSEFKSVVVLRIRDELNKLNKVLFPVKYIENAIQDLKQQLLDVIAGKMTVDDFRLKKSDEIKYLLSEPGCTEPVRRQLEEIQGFMNGKEQRGQDTFNAILKLESASVALGVDDSTAGKVLQGVVRVVTSDPEKLAQFRLNIPKVLGPVFRLLVFNKPGGEWAQDSIQNRAVALLQEAASKEGLLTDEEKIVFEKVLVDYQSFKTEDQRVQALIGAKEITISQQAALKALESSIQDSIQRVTNRYPNENQATAVNPEAPRYVQMNFKLPMLSALREDATQIDLLGKQIAAGKIKVVADPLPSDDRVGPEYEDDHSDATSLVTADEGVTLGTESLVTANEGVTEAAERDKDFEDALPKELQDEVDLAMGSISQLKTLAAQFSVHAQSVDSIGLAEEGLAIVTAFENSMPKNILDHNGGALQMQVEALKLLFNDAMNNQKLAVVASLQALRASVVNEFGSTVFPTATAGFKAQVARILTPQFKDSLSEGSAFKQFVVQELGILDSATETKAFFALLDHVQEALKQKEAGYAQSISELQDQDAVDALADYPKQGVLAATNVLIPKLEDAYRLAIFDTLTEKQRMAFKAHDSDLYEQLTLKKQAQVLKQQFESYLLHIYKIDFDTVTTVKQAQELLQGDDKSFGGVQKQLAMYEGFMNTLQSSNNVDLAFELYETVSPLYEKLKGVEKTFELLKSDKITDLITFKEMFKFYATHFLISDPFPFYKNDELEKFFTNPVGYLAAQEKFAQQDIIKLTQVGGKADPNKILKKAQKILKKLQKAVTTMQLTALKTEWESLESDYTPLREVYEQHQMVEAVVAQMLTPDVPLTFETDMQSPEGREKTVAFIARALSDRGSVYVPPHMILYDNTATTTSGALPTDRKTLFARLVATGKTTGSGTSEQPYRDLEHVLKNDLSWALEIIKLKGKSFSLTEKQKIGMSELFELLNQIQMENPELSGNMREINVVLAKIQATLASKVAVK